jgi:hypothetical protein
MNYFSADFLSTFLAIYIINFVCSSVRTGIVFFTYRNKLANSLPRCEELNTSRPFNFPTVGYFEGFHKLTAVVKSVFGIRIGFNSDPDPCSLGSAGQCRSLSFLSHITEFSL